MNNLQRYIKYLSSLALATMLLTPVLGWSHGAVDIPISRVVNCKVTGGYWSPPILDKGCEASAKIFNTDAEKAYAADQWNEVAHIPFINHPTLDQIKGIIKDENICAAGDPKKASLDEPTPLWTKTNVTPGQPLSIRLIGTIVHVPSTFYAFATKPGFNTATDKLKWSDLIPLGQPERITVASKNWQTPPAIPGADAFAMIVRPVPSNASGNGLIVGVWVRDDNDGEFFITCSDVKFQGGSEPDPLVSIGQFIKPEMQALKINDSVHYRIFSSQGERSEVVNITQKISASNFGPGQWGKQIADKVDRSIAQIGEIDGQNVKFNEVDALRNSTFVAQPGVTQAMSIIAGGGPAPVNPAPPIARISGPTSLKSGQAFTFNGTASTGSNGPLLFQWSIPGLAGSQNNSTADGVALTVTAQTSFKARVNIRDPDNGKTAQAEFDFIVTPSAGGGEYPAYVEGTAYKEGDIVTNDRKNYKCKGWPATGWCAGAAWAYSPGIGTAWQQAWDLVP